MYEKLDSIIQSQTEIKSELGKISTALFERDRCAGFRLDDIAANSLGSCDVVSKKSQS